ncbi:hypothetical protein CJ739_1258 [Mariniflexile rhizosphaerae]|nr:hypothetical protein CJ739_1258 [Mariniflexile sp. TRM1-10]
MGSYKKTASVEAVSYYMSNKIMFSLLKQLLYYLSFQ